MRLEGYRYMLGRTNIATNDIVCPVLALVRLRSETDTDTFIANDNFMKYEKDIGGINKRTSSM